MPSKLLLTKFRSPFVLLLIFCGSFSRAATFDTDSLEAVLKSAKPGWDRIDYAVGLARLYHTHKDARVQMRRMIDIIYEEARSQNLPDAVAYGLVMESIIAGVLDNDIDRREAALREAMDIAAKHNNNDAYVYAGYQLAQCYWHLKGDFQTAKVISEEILLYVDSTVDHKHVGNFYKTIGYVYTRIGLEDKGFEYLDLAASYLQRMRTDPFISPKIGRVSAQYGDIENLIQYVYNMISESKLRLGLPQESREYQKLALEMALAANVPFNTAFQYERIGMHFEKRGYFEQAIENYREANRVFEDYPNNPFSMRTNTNIARVMLAMDAKKDAMKYVFDVLPYYQEKNDTLHLCQNLITLSTALIRSGELDSAKSYLQQITSFEPSLNNPETKGEVYKVQAEYYLESKNLRKAVGFAQQAIDSYQQANNKLGIAGSYPLLARAQLASRNFESANETALEALVYARQQGNVFFTRQAYLLISEIYEQLGKVNEALGNYKLYMAYNDSVYTVDAQTKLKEEQVRKDVVAIQNEKQIAEATAGLLEEQNKQYLIAGALLLMLLILVAYLAINFRRVKSKVEDQNQQLSKLNQTKDKFFGVIAHDLRSPLVGLQSVSEQINFFIGKKQPEKVQEISEEVERTTKGLSELLDNLLNWALAQNGMIPFNPEKLNVHSSVANALDLFRPMAEMKQIDLQNKVDDDLELNADSKAIETIMRNLVSNALKFTEDRGTISITSNTSHQEVQIIVNDTGIGMTPDEVTKLFEMEKKSQPGTVGEKGSGLGLLLCKELVDMHKGKIDVKSQLGEGSQIVVTLPS